MAKARIFIVEDEKIVAADLQMSLENLGYHVLGIAASGQEAIDAIEIHRPDLVVMDIKLQGPMNGLEAARHIYQRQDIPIIYATAYVDEETIAQAKETEAYGYLLKPYEDKELQATIEVALYKHKLEMKVKLSENRYRQLFEESPTLNIVIGMDGRIQDINHQVELTLGFLKKELIGHFPLQYIAPSYQQKAKSKLERLVEGEPARNEEMDLLDSKGRLHTFLFSTVEMGSHDGQSDSILLAGRDITERKRNEEALRESENRYRELLENSDEIIQSMDPDGRIIFVNRVWKETLGYTEEDIRTVNLFDIIHHESHTCCRRLFQNVLDGKTIKSIQAVFMTRDGEKVYVEGNAAPWILGGDVIGTQGFFRDVTKQKLAEEELKKQRDFAESLIETAQTIVLVLDTKGRIIRFNRYMQEISGYRLDEVKNKDWFDMFLPKEDHDVTRSQFLKAIDGIQTRGDISPILTKDGSMRQITWYDKTLKDSNNRVIGLLSIGQDITEQIETEKEILRSYEVLRNLLAHLESVREEERSQISREIHDELGQTLTALKMDLYWLDHKLPKDHPPLEQKIKSMASLLDQTLQTVKRIASDLRPGLLDDLGLVAAIEWQKTEFQKRSGIHCRLTVNPQEMSVDREITTMIFRILQEALTNIARHARATRVSILLKETPRGLTLQVKDNGIGITVNQINDTKSLGLIGIQERVRQFNGSFRITGSPDQGTTVKVTIPHHSKGESLS